MRFTKIHRNLIWVVSIIVGTAIPVSAKADFNELLRFVPDDTNALIMVNSQAIFSSEYGQQHDLARRYQEQFSEMPLAMPPESTEFVLAAELDLEYLSPHWEVAVARFEKPQNISQLAQEHGGVTDTIQGKQCCVVGDKYIVQFTDKIYGMMWPARRNWVSRWILETKERQQPDLPPYLKQASRYPIEVGTEIVMALDLDDVVSPAAIASALDRSQAIGGLSEADETSVGRLFTGLRGIMLGIKFTDRMNAKLRVDFDRSAVALTGIAKPLIIEALSSAGALLPEFREWTEVVEGNSASITGVLSPEGARQLISLLAIDASAFQPQVPDAGAGEKPAPDTPPATDDPATEPPDPAVRTPSFEETVVRRETKRYVQRINQLVDDIKSGRKDSSVQNYVMYLDRYARKIDRMPATRVDPDITKLGKQIAENMNAMVSAFHDGAQRAQSRQNEVTPDVRVRAGGIPYRSVTTAYGRYYRYAPFGWAEVDTGATNRQREQITSQELQYATEQADKLMQQIEQSVTEMNQLYQQKFGE